MAALVAASFLLWFAASFAFGVHDTDLLVDLAVVLADHYYSPCVDIIHKSDLNEAEKHQIYRLYKALAMKKGGTVGAYSYERHANPADVPDDRRTTCLKPVKFVVGAGESENEFREMSRTLRMANALWLVALNSSVKQFFADARIPFDAELIVARVKSSERIELREVYRVDDGYPLRVNAVGVWTRKEGLKMSGGHLYERRFDLEGKPLRTGSIENWPMSSFANGVWDGYFPRIWKELEKLINCTTMPFRSVDNATGVLSSKGIWNGLVGMALRGELDAIVSEISINDERSKVLRFSRPVLISNYQVFFCARGNKLKWSAVLHPFSRGTWSAVCAWIVLGTATIYFCHRFSTEGENGYDDRFTPTVSFFFVLQSLCQQGYPTVPRPLPFRIIFVTSYLLSAVLIPSYSASLIYSLTHRSPNKPFDSFAEFLTKGGGYSLSVIRNSAQQAYFKRSENLLLRTVYARIRKSKSAVKSVKEGLEESFCRGKDQAFFGVESIVKMHMQHTYLPSCCHVMTFSKPLSPVHQCLAFVKDSPYGGLVNYKLQRLFSTGIIDNIQKHFRFERRSAKTYEEVEVDIDEVFQIFVLLLVGLILSVAFFAAERISGRKTARPRTGRLRK